MKSFCHLCLAECGLLINTDGTQILDIKPDTSDVISRGYICEKALRLNEYQTSPNRITSPLKKIGDQFETITWEQAIDEIASKLNGVRDSILYMAPLSPTYFFNTVYNFKLLAELGVKYITDVTSVEKVDQIIAQGEVFQAGLTADREHAETLLVVGKNSWITNHHPRARTIINDISNDPSRLLIVVDPVLTETAKKADIHVKLHPGTDVWFFLAVAKIIIDCGLSNYLIENHSEVVEQFSSIDLQYCLDVCGISKEQATTVATRIANTATSVDIENGIDHIPNSFNSHYLISLIILLTGNICKPGAMQISSRFITNNYFTQTLTPVTGHRQYLGAIPGSKVADNLDFRAVIIDNNNPADRLPNSKQFIEQLSKVDLVVALDSFHTASTRLADYILPTPTFHERYEIVNTLNKIEATLQLSKPILSCPPYAKTTTDIFIKLLGKMGLDCADSSCYNTTILSARDQLYQYYKRNLTVEDNEINDRVSQEIEQLVNCGKITYEKFYPNKKKYYIDPQRLTQLINVNQIPADEEYPYILACGVRNKKSLNNVLPNTSNTIEINSRSRFIQGDTVTLSTKHYSEQVIVVINNNLPDNYIRLTNSLGINKFTNNQGDGNPWYKYVHANLNK